MDLILCHTTADFDALGAAVGLTRLKPGAQVVLTGGCHPTVREFLAFYRDEYALIERRSVNVEQIRSLIVVDTQQGDRLGLAADWFYLPHLEHVELYDHHLDTATDLPVTHSIIEPVGATTTLIVERLQQLESLELTPAEATVMALGIHVDTGSLTYDSSTSRDALALAWLMTQGASLSVIGEYVEPGLSPRLQDLLTLALEQLHTTTCEGYQLSWVLLPTSDFVPGLSSIATRLMGLTHSDALLFGSWYETGQEKRLTVIGRSRQRCRSSSNPPLNLHTLFAPLGGGGHAQAASLTLREHNIETTFEDLVQHLQNQVPTAPTARELMSSPVRTILPETAIAQAQRILLRYGHSGLSVVNHQGELVGIISRRDLDIALHHGFSHAPVKGYMTPHLKTITPETQLPEIESLMVTYDIGRLPVLEDGNLVGIVTRSDVLRQFHLQETGQPVGANIQLNRLKSCYLPETMKQMLQESLTGPLQDLLRQAALAAEQRGWHLYLVGGGVRDLLLADAEKVINLQDVDLVVDGYHRAAQPGAGVELAKVLQQHYPGARLQIHGKFQTAALLWHKHSELDNLWIDIATARTEFYPYPAANPEVEASSIRQDLYRRDFTINALALRLTPPRIGEVLDFFGGILDLEAQLIRVLHANSFIEDPTRIYRAVRFAVRLGFRLEGQTEGYIRYAIASGVYDLSVAENNRAPALQTRLKNELKYILEAPYWKRAIQLLGNLDALKCIHSSLELTPELWKQLKLVDRCLRRFNPSGLCPPWQLLLEVMIAYLAPEYRYWVASGFQLPAESIERLKNLEAAKTTIFSLLPTCELPSTIANALQPYRFSTLILVMVQSPRLLRRKIWLYLWKLAQVKPILNGNDLKQLGYKPGRQFKAILDKLLEMTLDGELADRASAETFLEKQFRYSAKR
ncbi:MULTISPECIES: CBS domain-containing protein [unclassified Roseofilum]|uniref:CBS domain-containing protein n=1 Tax=unclassified Roseofilum TaxID=2620099 RepID=UPI001B0C35EE|nr:MULTISPECIES: CBS domain-containing protein [unclassified Roseofilum]MBP0011157.1 CBS domain-containing protein [Roseofilum sp. Belize Diploria]MBP0014965.1 CBS domain-containing protein [Roseofilum sp. SID3]MBP0026323.1 CBS domain-containing protein [Roseofilum sp. SID2]MBP0036327.1 CBS domain-containing protein [Roseofilum sp. SID1]MBP0042062.1 CBS domain-containing protein [Roseofilum sp. SBFL]